MTVKYGDNGNVSVPPPVILKLMLLLVFYNVRSERELMATLPERLDWLWFLGYDLDSEIPDHSVLSQGARRGQGHRRGQGQVLKYQFFLVIVSNVSSYRSSFLAPPPEMPRKSSSVRGWVAAIDSRVLSCRHGVLPFAPYR